MDITTTRRSLLCISTVAAAAATTPFAAAFPTTIAPVGNVSPALLDLIASVAAINADNDRFYADVLNPAVDRASELRAAIPHVTISPPKGWSGDPLFWSTDHRDGAAMAKALVAHEPRTSIRSDVVCARKLIAAIHRRDRAGKRIDRATGLAAAKDWETDLYIPYNHAQAAVYAFPVSSMADLQAKLAFIDSDDGMDGEDLLPLVIRDVARLSGGGA